ncbi:MAG: UTP--glucose-1-phosphate uridylyltransferase, partial [Deltaproteobacteria bacterium]|nr:UTP--glucose-1-phosphate uridylyltransferase [Deltaproteobacteria bacterium]
FIRDLSRVVDFIELIGESEYSQEIQKLLQGIYDIDLEDLSPEGYEKLVSILYDEDGEEVDVEVLIDFYEAIFDFIGLIKGGNLIEDFNYIYGVDIDFDNLTKDDLEIFEGILFDSAGNLISDEKLYEAVQLYPFASTILRGLDEQAISPSFFIKWTKGRTNADKQSFEISALPSPINLNPGLEATYGKENLLHFSDAVFTMAFYMQHILDEFDKFNLDVDDFNFVYGLDSLDDDYELNRDTEVASILFMIISEYPGNFAEQFNGSEFAERIPHVASALRLLSYNGDFIRAINRFFGLDLPYSSSLSLNPRDTEPDALLKRGQFLFELANAIEEGIYENAESYMEMILKVDEHWDEIEEAVGHAIVIDPYDIAFEYRIIGGVAAIFIHDGYDFSTEYINPYSIAKYSITFVADADSLYTLRTRHTRDAYLIAEAEDILSVSEREFIDEKNHEVGHRVYYLHEDGEPFYESLHIYDAHPARGYLLQETTYDDEHGYQLRTEYDYTTRRWLIEGPRLLPVYVPAGAKTYVETDAQTIPYSETVNLNVFEDSRQIKQKITYFAGNGLVSKVVHRTSGLYAGNPIQDREFFVEEQGALEEDRVINYEYSKAFYEALGLATSTDTYDFEGNLLSRSRLADTQEGFLIVESEDFVRKVTEKETIDYLGKVHSQETTRVSSDTPYRIVKNYFQSPYLAGFAAPSRSVSIDPFTGITISESYPVALDEDAFNEFGGITSIEQNNVERISQIILTDARGLIRQQFEGEDVAFINGSIIADVVMHNIYEDRYWRARNIASRTERHAWDAHSQKEDGLISYTVAEELTDITTDFGIFRVLELSEHKEGVDTESTLYVDLSTGKLTRMEAEDRVTDIAYNSLDIEQQSIVKSARGEVIEKTESILDRAGRPVLPLSVPQDIRGNLRSHLIKEAYNPNTGTDRWLVQDLSNGLLEYIMVSPTNIALDTQWWTKVSHSNLELETATQTMVYVGGIAKGKVKETKTLVISGGIIRKQEVFANGLRIEYDQDALTGLIDNIQREIGTISAVWIDKIKRNSVGVAVNIETRTKDGRFVSESGLEEIDIDSQIIISTYRMATGEEGRRVVDVQTGLTLKIIRESDIPGAGRVAWTEYFNYDVQGRQEDSQFKNSEGEVVSNAEVYEYRDGKAYSTYQMATGERGRREVDIQTGLTLLIVRESDIPGAGHIIWREEFTYDTQGRQTNSTIRNSANEIVSEAFVEARDTGNHTVASTFRVATGEEGRRLVDVQTGLTLEITRESDIFGSGHIIWTEYFTYDAQGRQKGSQVNNSGGELVASAEVFGYKDGKVLSAYQMVGGEGGTRIVDVQTGLTIQFIQELDLIGAGPTIWTSDIQYDTRGIELSRETIADDGRVVSRSERVGIDTANKTIISKYFFTAGKAQGINVVDVQTGLIIVQVDTKEDIYYQNLYDNQGVPLGSDNYCALYAPANSQLYETGKPVSKTRYTGERITGKIDDREIEVEVVAEYKWTDSSDLAVIMGQELVKMMAVAKVMPQERRVPIEIFRVRANILTGKPAIVSVVEMDKIGEDEGAQTYLLKTEAEGEYSLQRKIAYAVGQDSDSYNFAHWKEVLSRHGFNDVAQDLDDSRLFTVSILAEDEKTVSRSWQVITKYGYDKELGAIDEEKATITFNVYNPDLRTPPEDGRVGGLTFTLDTGELLNASYVLDDRTEIEKNNLSIDTRRVLTVNFGTKTAFIEYVNRLYGTLEQKEKVRLKGDYDKDFYIQRMHRLSQTQDSLLSAAGDIAARVVIEASEHPYYNSSDKYSQDFLRFLGIPSHSIDFLITKEYPEGWLQSVSTLKDIELGDDFMRVSALQIERFSDDLCTYTLARSIVKDGYGLLLESQDGKLLSVNGTVLGENEYPDTVDEILRLVRNFKFQPQEGDLKIYSFYLKPSQRADCLGRYGVADISVTTIRIRGKEVIYAYSNYTTIDEEGNVPYSTVRGRASFTDAGGDVEITHGNLYKCLVNGNCPHHGKIDFYQVYESRNEVKDNMGRITGIGSGFKAWQLDPDNHYLPLKGEMSPRITFLSYSEEGDDRLAMESKMYRFDERANHGSRWYNLGWYRENAGPILIITNPRIAMEEVPVTLYDAFIKDVLSIDPGQRGLLMQATRLADGRPYYQLQEGEGFEIIKTYFRPDALSGRAVLTRDRTGLQLPYEEPYEETYIRFESPLGMDVYTIPAGEDLSGTVQRWALEDDKWLPADVRVEKKRFVNGTLVSVDENRHITTEDGEYVEGPLRHLIPGVKDRLYNNIIGKYIREIWNGHVDNDADDNHDVEQGDDSDQDQDSEDEVNAEVQKVSKAVGYTPHRPIYVLAVIACFFVLTGIVKELRKLFGKKPTLNNNGQGPRPVSEAGVPKVVSDLLRKKDKDGNPILSEKKWEEILTKVEAEPGLDTQADLDERLTRRAVYEAYRPYIDRILSDFGMTAKESKYEWDIIKFLRQDPMVPFHDKSKHENSEAYHKDIDGFDIREEIVQHIISHIKNTISNSYAAASDTKEGESQCGLYVKVERQFSDKTASKGWIKRPLEEVVLEQLIAFLFGDLQQNRAYLEYIRKNVIEKFISLGQKGRIIPEVIVRSAFWSILISSQFGHLKARIREATEEWNMVYEDHLASLFWEMFTILFEADKDPLYTCGINYGYLTGVLPGVLTDNNFYLLQELRENLDNPNFSFKKLKKEEISYPVLWQIFNVLDKDTKTALIQDIVDTRLIPYVKPFLKERQHDMIFTFPSKFVRPSRMLQFMNKVSWPKILLVSLTMASPAMWAILSGKFANPMPLWFLLAFAGVLLLAGAAAHLVSKISKKRRNVTRGVSSKIILVSLAMAGAALSAILSVKFANPMRFWLLLEFAGALLLARAVAHLVSKKWKNVPRGAPGLIDFGLGVIAAVDNNPRTCGLSQEMWDKFDEPRKDKIRRGVGFFKTFGSFVPRLRELLVGVASLFSAWLVSSWVLGASGSHFLAKITLVAVLFIIPYLYHKITTLLIPYLFNTVMKKFNRTKRWSYSWGLGVSAMINVFIPAITILFGLPALAAQWRLSPLTFYLLIVPFEIFVLLLLFLISPRLGMYFGQRLTIAKAILKRRLYEVRYNSDISWFLDKLAGRRGIGAGSVIMTLTGIVSFSWGIKTLYLSGLALPWPVALVSSLSILFGLTSVWNIIHKLSLRRNFQYHNYQLPGTSPDNARKIAESRVTEAIYKMYQDNFISKEERDAWLRRVYKSPKLDDARERLLRIAYTFYRLDLTELLKKFSWGDLQKMTVFQHSYGEDLLFTFEELSEYVCGDEETDRERRAYPTYLNKLVCLTHQYDWKNFVNFLFDEEGIEKIIDDSAVESLNDLYGEQRKSRFREITSNKSVRKIRKLLLRAAFESPEQTTALMKEIIARSRTESDSEQKVGVKIDLDKLKDKITHWANMRLPTVYRSLEGVKFFQDLGYRHIVEQLFASEGYFSSPYRNTYENLDNRRKLARKILDILSQRHNRDGLRFEKKRKLEDRWIALRGAVWRNDWLALMWLNSEERELILGAGSSLSGDEKKFLIWDECLQKHINEKLNYVISRKRGDKEDEYFRRPENKYLFTLFATTPPGAVGGPVGIIEWLQSAKAGIVAITGRYRSQLSIRIDAIMEIRPEEAFWSPYFAAQMGQPNVAGTVFPMYAADRRLNFVLANESEAECTWTQYVQLWMDEVGVLGQYGKFGQKEIYERTSISPITRAAEDLTLAFNQLAEGLELAYFPAMLIGGAKGATYALALGPNKKYSADYYEMIQDYFGVNLAHSDKAPANWKYTHFFNTGGFYGLKPAILLAAILFNLFLVSLNLDPFIALPLTALFFIYYLCSSQAINLNTILRLNNQYGFPFGFFRFLWRLLIYPGMLWHFLSFIPHYVRTQQIDTNQGRARFPPTVRTPDYERFTSKRLYITNDFSMRFAAALVPFLVIVRPHTPLHFFSTFIYICFVLAALLYPYYANPRPDTRSFPHSVKAKLTNWVAPLAIMAATAFIGLIYRGFNLNIFLVISGLYFIFWLIGQISRLRDNIKGVNIIQNSTKLVLITLAVMSMCYQPLAFIPIIVSLIDPNKRYFAKDVVIGGGYALGRGICANIGYISRKSWWARLCLFAVPIFCFVAMWSYKKVIVGLVISLTDVALLLILFFAAITFGRFCWRYFKYIRILKQLDKELPQLNNNNYYTVDYIGKKLLGKSGRWLTKPANTRILRRALATLKHELRLKSATFSFEDIINPNRPFIKEQVRLNQLIVEQLARGEFSEWEELLGKLKKKFQYVDGPGDEVSLPDEFIRALAIKLGLMKEEDEELPDEIKDRLNPLKERTEAVMSQLKKGKLEEWQEYLLDKLSLPLLSRLKSSHLQEWEEFLIGLQDEFGFDMNDRRILAQAEFEDRGETIKTLRKMKLSLKFTENLAERLDLSKREAAPFSKLIGKNYIDYGALSKLIDEVSGEISAIIKVRLEKELINFIDQLSEEGGYLKDEEEKKETLELIRKAFRDKGGKLKARDISDIIKKDISAKMEEENLPYEYRARKRIRDKMAKIRAQAEGQPHVEGGSPGVENIFKAIEEMFYLAIAARITAWANARVYRRTPEKKFWEEAERALKDNFKDAEDVQDDGKLSPGFIDVLKKQAERLKIELSEHKLRLIIRRIESVRASLKKGSLEEWEEYLKRRVIRPLLVHLDSGSSQRRNVLAPAANVIVEPYYEEKVLKSKVIKKILKFRVKEGEEILAGMRCGAEKKLTRALEDWFSYFGQAPPKKLPFFIVDKNNLEERDVVVLPQDLFTDKKHPEILLGVLAERLYRFLSHTYLTEEQAGTTTEEFLLWDYFWKFDQDPKSSGRSIIQGTIDAKRFSSFTLVSEAWFKGVSSLDGALKVLKSQHAKLSSKQEESEKQEEREGRLKTLLNFILEGYRYPEDRFKQQELLRNVYLEALNRRVFTNPGTTKKDRLDYEEVSLRRPVAPFRCFTVLRLLYAIQKTKKEADWDNFFRALTDNKNKKISYLHAYQNIKLEEHLKMAEEFFKSKPHFIDFILAMHHLSFIFAKTLLGKEDKRGTDILRDVNAVIKKQKAIGQVANKDEAEYVKRALELMEKNRYVANLGMNPDFDEPRPYPVWQLVRNLILMNEHIFGPVDMAKLDICLSSLEQCAKWERGNDEEPGDSAVYPTEGKFTCLDIELGKAKQAINDLPGLSADQKLKIQKGLKAGKGNKGTIISYEDLYTIGEAVGIPRAVITVSGGGKGTRYAMIKFNPQTEEFVISDKAKGCYKVPFKLKESGREEWLTILHVRILQAQDLNQRYLGPDKLLKKKIPFVVYSSFMTDKDIRDDLKRLGYRPSADNPDFYVLENDNPKEYLSREFAPDVRVIRLREVFLFDRNTGDFYRFSEPYMHHTEWLWSDAHDSAFLDFYTSGVASQYLDKGYRYATVGNIDNCAAVLDPILLGMQIITQAPLVNEIPVKPAGQKGGAPVKLVDTIPQMLGRLKGLIEGFEQKKEVFNNLSLEEIAEYMPLFNSANYMMDIRRLYQQAYMRDEKYATSESQVDTQIRQFTTTDEEERYRLKFLLIESVYRFITQLWEADKMHPAWDASNLAGTITRLVDTLFVDVPTGESAGRYTRFEPLKENIINFRNERLFISALLQNNFLYTKIEDACLDENEKAIKELYESIYDEHPAPEERDFGPGIMKREADTLIIRIGPELPGIVRDNPKLAEEVVREWIKSGRIRLLFVNEDSGDIDLEGIENIVFESIAVSHPQYDTACRMYLDRAKTQLHGRLRYMQKKYRGKTLATILSAAKKGEKNLNQSLARVAEKRGPSAISAKVEAALAATLKAALPGGPVKVVPSDEGLEIVIDKDLPQIVKDNEQIAKQIIREWIKNEKLLIQLQKKPKSLKQILKESFKDVTALTQLLKSRRDFTFVGEKDVKDIRFAS